MSFSSKSIYTGGVVTNSKIARPNRAVKNRTEPKQTNQTKTEYKGVIRIWGVPVQNRTKPNHSIYNSKIILFRYL